MADSACDQKRWSPRDAAKTEGGCRPTDFLPALLRSFSQIAKTGSGLSHWRSYTTLSSPSPYHPSDKNRERDTTDRCWIISRSPFVGSCGLSTNFQIGIYCEYHQHIVSISDEYACPLFAPSSPSPSRWTARCYRILRVCFLFASRHVQVYRRGIRQRCTPNNVAPSWKGSASRFQHSSIPAFQEGFVLHIRSSRAILPADFNTYSSLFLVPSWD